MGYSAYPARGTQHICAPARSRAEDCACVRVQGGFPWNSVRSCVANHSAMLLLLEPDPARRREMAAHFSPPDPRDLVRGILSDMCSNGVDGCVSAWARQRVGHGHGPPQPKSRAHTATTNTWLVLCCVCSCVSKLCPPACFAGSRSQRAWASFCACWVTRPAPWPTAARKPWACT